MPGDLAGRVKTTGDSVEFTWPKGSGRNARPASTKTFDAGGVKRELIAAGVTDVSKRKLCVLFQFMYALSATWADDDKRLAYAHRFCACPKDRYHNSATASAHEQISGLDRALLLRHES